MANDTRPAQPSETQAQPNAKSPDMQVAMRIVAQLEVRDLIAPEQSAPLRARIAAGALTPEDWVLVARQAINRDPDADDGYLHD